MSWDGGGDGSTWQDPQNWSSDLLPGFQDDVVIDVAANPSITFSTALPTTIRSLTSRESLTIVSGTLALTAGASQADASFTMAQGAGLLVDGPATTFLATGATTVNGASLVALGGGQIRLPAVSAYAGGTEFGLPALRADGPGSVLDLSSVTSLVGQTNFGSLLVQAIGGGRVKFGAVSAIVDGGVNVMASGSGSIVEMPTLSRFASDRGRLDIADGGTIQAQLTTVNNVQLSFAGSGTLDVNRLVDLTGSSVLVRGGAALALPAVTAYAGGNVALFPTLRAEGPGSVLDLSSVTSLAGQTNFTLLQVQAAGGGRVKLGGVAAMTQGNVSLLSDGAGSVVDVSSLSRLISPGGGLTGGLEVRDGGTILARLTVVNDAQLKVTGGGTLDVSQLTDLTGSSVIVSGGANLSLPAVTAYAGGTVVFFPALRAEGAGSVLDLSSVTSLVGQTNFASLQVQAVGGGRVKLGGVTAVTRGGVSLLSDGAGSVVDVSALSRLVSPNGGVEVRNGGTILARLTLINDAQLKVTGGGTLDVSQLTDLTGSSVIVSGGANLSLPAVTTYSGDAAAILANLRAEGAGSVLDLPSLTSITDLTGAPSLFLSATAGGRLKFRVLTSMQSGFLSMVSEGGGSAIEVSSTLRINSAAFLTTRDGGTIRLGGDPTTGPGGGVVIAAGGLLSVGSSLSVTATSFTNQGTLEALSGATVDVNTPATIDGAGRLASAPLGTISFGGSQAGDSVLLGNTVNADQYAPLGLTTFRGMGTAAAPQRLEAMGRDLGADASGFRRNFVYGALSLTSNTFLKLVDLSRNVPGTTGADAVYVQTLVVTAGATLDLNGLHLYVRAAQLEGTVIGGSVVQVPDSGPIVPGSPIPGAISAPGELDEWSFFGRGGRSMTIVVNPAAGGMPSLLPPSLGDCEVRLVDGAGNVLAAASSTFTGQVVTLSGVVLPADGTYRIQVRADLTHSEKTGNYLVSVYDSTPDVAPLMLNQLVSGRIESPYSVDRWVFSAEAGQQVRFDRVNSAGPGIVYDLAGPGGWTGFQGIADDSDLITLPGSGTYTLTVRGASGSNGGLYAFRLQETALTALALGTTYSGTFPGNGSARLFRVDVPAGIPMLVRLDDSSGIDRNEVYAKYGAPPTRSDFDERSPTAAAADQKVLVPLATAGAWFILVYGDSVPAPSAYTLSAVASGLFLYGVTPDHHGDSAVATLTLTGAGFDSTTTVTLVGADGVGRAATGLTNDSFTQMTATFAAGSVPPGVYTVRASHTDGTSGELPGAFRMVAGGKAVLKTNIVVPSVVGRHTTGTLYVEYANTGDLAMPAPLLTLHGSDNAFLTLDQSLQGVGYWTSAQPAGFSDAVQILASGATPGLLQPGESLRVPVYYAGLQQPWDFQDTQVDFHLDVIQADDATPTDWTRFESQLRPTFVAPEAWTPIFANFLARIGSTGGSFVSMLDADAAYLGRLGQKVVDGNALLAFALQQADGLRPVSTLAGNVDAVVDAPGLSLTFVRSFGIGIEQRYAMGRLGRGWSDNWQVALQWIADGTVIITTPGGGTRVFQPDTRTGGYFGQPGDHATLTALAGAAFLLRETDGLLTRFLPDGNIDFIEDPNGNRITASYASGRLTRLTHSSGQSLQIDYNAAGRIHQVADQLGHITTYTYDALGEHLLSVTGPLGATSYSYASGLGAAREHALTSIAYPGGTHQFFTFDGNGRLATTARDGDVERATFTYPGAGQVDITDATGATSTLYFDQRALVVETRDALGHTVSQSFDADYNLTRITDPTGRSSAFAYDASGAVVQTTDALGHVTRFTYTGAFHRLAALTDAKGNRMRYDYDDRGNLQTTTYADGSVERLAYDTFGDAETVTNRRGMPIAYTHDAAGRVTSKSFADGSHTDYGYDPRGNLTTATDASGTTAMIYEPVTDRLTKITYPNGRFLQFTYDAGGRRTRSVDQDGFSVNYTYDAVGRLLGLQDNTGANIVTYTYDLAGRLTREDKGNGTYTTYEYEGAGQLLHLVNYAPGGTVNSRFDYTYDVLGRRTTMGTLDGLWTYTYDDTGQLTRAVLASTNAAIPSQDLNYFVSFRQGCLNRSS